MSDIKLTKAQREWLEKLALSPQWTPFRHAPSTIVADRYHLAREECPTNGRNYTITPAGRAWLAANPRRTK